MAKRYSIDEALTLVEQFLANPADVDLQVKVTDMGRRFPVAAVLLAAGKLDTLIHGMPYYMTLRKTQDGVMNIEGAELKAAIQAIPSTGPGDSTLEEGEEDLDETDTAEEVDVTPKKVRLPRAAKNTPAAVVAATPSVTSLFEDEE